MKKQTIITACTFAAMTMATPAIFAVQPAMSNHVCASDAIKKDNRPVESKRLFCSKAVEERREARHICLHRRYPCHVAPRLRCAGVALRTAGQ